MEKAPATMSDHDRLIRTDERTMRIEEDIAEIKEWIKLRPCPSKDCQECKRRLGILEDHEKIVIGVIVTCIIGSGALVWALSKFFGG